MERNKCAYDELTGQIRKMEEEVERLTLRGVEQEKKFEEKRLRLEKDREKFEADLRARFEEEKLASTNRLSLDHRTELEKERMELEQKYTRERDLLSDHFSERESQLKNGAMRWEEEYQAQVRVCEKIAKEKEAALDRIKEIEESRLKEVEELK